MIKAGECCYIIVLEFKKAGIMKIQLNTDHNIQGTESLEKNVIEKLQRDLKHYTKKITRIEIHLTDQNANKGGDDDIQCKMEARVEGMQPLIVVSRKRNKEVALDDAVDKMKAALSSRIGKMRDK